MFTLLNLYTFSTFQLKTVRKELNLFYFESYFSSKEVDSRQRNKFVLYAFSEIKFMNYFKSKIYKFGSRSRAAERRGQERQFAPVP